MNILGISGQDRDAAAALVSDGRVIAAIEEEKLSRVRHVGLSYAGGLPMQAIQHCLDAAGIGFGRIDYVAYYTEPRKLFVRNLAFRTSRVLLNPGKRSLEAFPYYLVDSLNNLRQRLRTAVLARGKLGPGARFVNVNHQMAHAAAAFYASGFDRAAVITAGNVGDMRSTALLTGDAAGLKIQHQAKFPNSLGMVFTAVTAALGFDPAGDEHKTMWLAPTGEDEFAGVFRSLIGLDSRGLPRVNLDYFDGSFKGDPGLSGRFFKETGLNPGGKRDPVTRAHRNVATSLQNRINEVLVEMADRHRRRTGQENLCLSGGVALNSLANAAVEQAAGFNRLFVQPASGNAGCSVGAALYCWHDVLGHKERVYKMKDLYLGPRFGEEKIKTVLDNCKLQYEYYLTDNKLVDEVAGLLAKGRIAGWFRGPMEFGPRALGSRSILASPASGVMGENLNTYIKHREDFRPFSASVPEERAAEFFEPSALTNFLQGVCRVRPDKRDVIPAAIFGDNIARVHTVGKRTNPAFWRLLTRFGEIAGVPVLLNTSFNLFGEPVVSTPREAVRGFYCSGIDCLALENFLIKK
jgi:carbamoyltransferase